MKIKIKLILLILIPLPLFSSQDKPLFLKSRISEGKSGDYIILAKGNSYSFLSLSQEKDQTLLKEIYYPHLSKKEIMDPLPWKDKPSVLTSLSKSSTFHIPKNSISQSLPLKKQHAVEEELFLTTLLSLPFYPLGKDGPSSPSTISVSIEGIKQTIPVLVFSSLWPEDHSPLSKKKLFIFLTDPNITPFPVKILLESPKGRITFRCIDAGRSF